MIRRLTIAIALGACLMVAALGSNPAAAATGAEWNLTVSPNADYFLSGQSLGVYKIEAENVGSEPTSGEISLEDVIPSGLTAEGVKFYVMKAPGANPESLEALLSGSDFSGFLCPSKTECHFPGELSEFGITALNPGQRLIMVVLVRIPGNVTGSLEDVAKISGGGPPSAEVSAVNTASDESPPVGTLHFGSSLTDGGGTPYFQAGGHPYQFTTEFNFETFSYVSSVGSDWQSFGTGPVPDPKDISALLPPGLIANPQGVPRCLLAAYFTQECDVTNDSVGFANIRIFGRHEGGTISPIVNLEPAGAYPGQLGISLGGLPIIMITTGIRSGADYGVSATNLAAQADLNRVILTLWGVPADEGHDSLRGKECQLGISSLKNFSSPAAMQRECEGESTAEGGGPAEVEPTPFITMPTDCSGEPLNVSGRYDGWQHPGEYAMDSVELAAVDGCNSVQFNPRIEARPTTNLADAPSGFDFNLHVPQNEDPEGVATSDLKEAVIRLPKGLSLNPAAGDGLETCTEAQIGLHVEEPAHCPDASKLGSAEVLSPLLNEPLDGFLYLATPHQNPPGSLLAGYLEVEGQGIRIKLAGEFETDPKTGQITTRFTENPQLPFEDLKLHIFEGARGALRTPAVCGAYETTSELTPFSAPESGPPATPSAEFETTTGPTGGECAFSEADLPDAPRFIAGTETPQAGIYSPFSLRLVRDDGTQEVKSVETTLPKGLVGRLAGTSYCPEASIAAAEAKTGKEEQSSPSCPASSEVGTVDVGAGAGPTPLNVPGHVYLAGPYKGAPLSMAIITPAVAGPFDLGTVVVRAALHVDPETTQIHAVSDPIPTILEGIPLDVRSVTLQLSKPDFTLNPTDCSESAFSGSTTSILDIAAPLTQRFQVGGCPALAFKPKLSLQLKGGTKRTKHPALTAVLKMPPGDANIAAAQVTLPHSDILDQGHIGTICTKVQFAANACPAKSVYGRARAFSPLLDQPLEGPVYLRSSSHELPDLVADLNGQIQVVLAGRVDAVHERLRTTFEAVPDAPVSKFVLQMQGGKKGLLQNKTNICNSRQRATVTFTAHNAKSQETNPALKVRCGGHHKKHKRHHR